MFEKELDRVRKHLKQVLDTRQPHIPLAAIVANESIHPAYRAFFRAEADWWLHEERAIRASNPRFDTSTDEIVRLFKDLDAAYLRAARFDHEELTATIDAAVKTRLNFLVRPRTTLKWFVYRGEPTKTLHEVLLRLNYLTDNRYLLDGLRAWASGRPSESSMQEILSVVEFERIVEKIDNDAILDLSQDEFVRLLDEMYRFFADADPDLPPESIPTEAVIIFLDDKGAVPISQALERLLYREDLRTLTRTKLIDVIDTVIANLGTPLPEPAPQAPSPAMPTPEPTVVPVATVEPEPEPEPAPEPTPEPAPEPEQEPEPGPAPASVRVTRFAGLIDASTRDRIIKKIFARDIGAFEATVADVLAHEQWKEAAGALDRFLARQGVAPDSVAAMEFAQALHRSYL
jgi:hypothetical protein